VADKLIDEWKCKILLFGSEKDSSSVNQVVASMRNEAINLCGKTNIKTLSFLISKCHLFITNDSGPMHLASASQIPLVAIFGPTTRELGFFPLGAKSIVVEIDLPCRPCSLHGGEKCPLGHFKCMKEISAEMVLEPARKFLFDKSKSVTAK
jgi:heptosyltransferase II